jgi:hypothetical protein
MVPNRFNLKVFLSLCEADLPEFEINEKLHYEENQLITMSGPEISAKFNRGLDEIRMALEFIPEELYISTWTNGRIAVNFGATLLNLRVDFLAPVDIVSLRHQSKRKGRSFLYEKVVIEEHNRCATQYQLYSQEIKQAFNASRASKGQLMIAIEHVSNAIKHLSVHLNALGTKLGSRPAKQVYNMELQNHRGILRLLRGYLDLK